MGFGDQAAAIGHVTSAMQAAIQQSAYYAAQIEKANTQTYTSTDGNGNAVGFNGVAAGDLLTQFENYEKAKAIGDTRTVVLLRAMLMEFGANLFGVAGPSGKRPATIDEFEEAWKKQQGDPKSIGGLHQKIDKLAKKDCGVTQPQLEATLKKVSSGAATLGTMSLTGGFR